MLRNGELPNFKKYLADRGILVENAITVFPSTTGPAHAPFINGCFPGRMNVTGIRWFDRHTFTFRNYCGPQFPLVNKDISNNIPSIYKDLKNYRTVSVFEFVRPGSLLNQNIPPLLNVYGKLLDRWKDVDILAFEQARLFYKGADIFNFKNRLMELPRFLAIWCPGEDETEHAHGPLSRRAREVLKVDDKYFGRLIETLKDTGIYDSTVIVVSADHGQRPTHSHFKTTEFLKSLGFDVKDKPFERNCDVVFALSGNGFAMLYFKSPSGSFKTRPTYDELRAYPVKGRKVDIIEEFRKRKEVKFTIVREGLNLIHVFTSTGEGLIRFKHKKGKRYIGYKVIEGEDPFEYSKFIPEMVNYKYYNSEKWLEATCTLNYPDAPVQIVQLFESPRVGDIVLSSTIGWDLAFERPEHHGTHGGLERAEMVVPLLIAGPGIPHKTIKCARTVDVYPTFLDCFGIKIPKNIDGISIFKRLKN